MENFVAAGGLSYARSRNLGKHWHTLDQRGNFPRGITANGKQAINSILNLRAGTRFDLNGFGVVSGISAHVMDVPGPQRSPGLGPLLIRRCRARAAPVVRRADARCAVLSKVP